MIQSEAYNISSTGRILRWPELQHKVGYSRSNVYRLIDQGHFPPTDKARGKGSGLARIRG